MDPDPVVVPLLSDTPGVAAEKCKVTRTRKRDVEPATRGTSKDSGPDVRFSIASSREVRDAMAD
jgi:hypothetical protein